MGGSSCIFDRNREGNVTTTTRKTETPWTNDPVEPPEAGDSERVACTPRRSERSVPFLSGGNVRRRVTRGGTIVRCTACGLAYVNPQPTRKGIAPYYTEGYSPHRFGPPTPAERLYYRLFRMPPRPTRSRIPDVDCGGAAKESARSVGYYLSLERSLYEWLSSILALLFNMTARSLRRSGLITAYALRP
jgi:hypothetical protein